MAPCFYFGILASSIGSFAFNVALIAFMLKNGFHLGHASLIIALQRFVPVVTMGLWGHLTDRISPTTTVAVSEVIAGLCSVTLLIVWNGTQTHYPTLVAICVIRAVVVSFQTGSRNKITKLFSDETYAANCKNAIWLNKATQGATLFGGLLAWFLVRHFSIEVAIILDGMTFLLNGIIALLIPNLNLSQKEVFIPLSWKQKFSDLFNYNYKSALLDILLVIPMMGTVAYMSRLAGSDQSLAGVYMACYGLAVWAAGYLERSTISKYSSRPFWIFLGIGFIILGYLPKQSLLILPILFLKDFSFWIIFHRISSYMQTDTPTEKIGSVMSARNCIITAILTSGEVMVGAWSHVVPLSTESMVRGLFALTAGLVLIVASQKYPSLENRPAL